MSAPAPIRPVLEASPTSHDRHSVLLRAVYRLARRGAPASAIRLSMWACADTLLDCPCDEGKALRVAVKQWAGLSNKATIPIVVRNTAAAPTVEGERGAIATLRTARRVKGRATRPRTRNRVYLLSTRRVVVGPEFVLYLAGWPVELTGVEFCPML